MATAVDTVEQKAELDIAETVTLRVFRGDASGGAERDYEVPEPTEASFTEPAA